MGKSFNVTGLCVPSKHYMVNLESRIKQIRKMIDAGDYFIINRARQYGKTTTLAALAKELAADYFVISLDFQALGSASFQDENTFSLAFLQIFLREMKRIRMTEISGIDERTVEIREVLSKRRKSFDLLALFEYLLGVCEYSPRPIVLMIDEIDSASNNQVFLDFLAQLRSYYLERDIKETPVFQSVILAGVYDIRNLKRKIRSDEEHKVNSPWNIAADFDIAMELREDGIENMLKEYAGERHIHINTGEIAGLLYRYTAGYPYLVSKLCKLMDEKVSKEKNAWSKDGFLEALRMLLSENNMLFESLIGKLADYPELNHMLEELLFQGKEITYTPTSQPISLALMFGFVKNENGRVIPANRIFDTLLYNHFLSTEEGYSADIYKASLQDKNQFVMGRTDIIIDYRGEQFVVEIKIWRGNEYNSRGEHQLAGYLKDYCLNKGYMLSFNFNQKKQPGVHEIIVAGKTIIEAVV